MPRLVVYASKSIGGIGLQNLYVEQGLSQVLYILGCWRINNDDSITLKTLIESYIIASGIYKCPFEDCRVMEYVQSDWIDSIKIFLDSIKGHITINNITKFDKWRIRDEQIMEKAMRYIDNKNKLKAINNCRIYLEAFTVAEICNFEGTHILSEAYYGKIDSKGKKMINKYSRSTLIWPKQPRPPEKAWRIWRKWILIFTYKDNLELKTKLGRWLPNQNPNRIWYKDGKITNENIPIIHTIRQRNSNITMNEIELINGMTTIQILISNKVQQDNTEITWAVWEDSTNIKILKRQLIHPNIRKDRCDLLTLNNAVTTIMKYYTKYNTKPKPDSLIIWTSSQKLYKQLKMMRYEQDTIYKLTKTDAELIQDNKYLLKNFPNYAIRGTDDIQKTTDYNVTKIEDMVNKSGSNMQRLQKDEYLPSIVLYIDKQPIWDEITTKIRNNATLKAYMSYVKAKYDWNNNQIQMVDWEAIEYSTRKLDSLYEKFVTKYIHGWLPTRGHPGCHSDDSLTQKCPLCGYHTETNKHFRTCKWKARENATKLFDKNNGNGKLKCDGIESTLYKAIKSVMSKEQVTTNSKFVEIANEQSLIGWDQMIIGRVSCKWSEEYNKETNTKNGKQWISKVISNLWENAKERWDERNASVSEDNITTIEDNRRLADAKIIDLYSQSHKLDSIDNRMLKVPVQTRLNMKLKHKIEWLTRTKQMIKIGMKRFKMRTKIKNHSIMKYFKRDTALQQDKSARQDTIEQSLRTKQKSKIRKENLKPP
jgi:hypothetical protein